MITCNVELRRGGGVSGVIPDPESDIDSDEELSDKELSDEELSDEEPSFRLAKNKFVFGLAPKRV